jgi:hypothetical protein
MRRAVPLVLLAACGGPQSTDDRDDRAECAVVVGAPRPIAIPARLTAIAPQFFHAGVRDGFNDLVAGTKRYDWYDPANLDVKIVPPEGMDIIWRATPSYFLGWTDNALMIARRGDKTATRVPTEKMHILDFVEDANGNAWALTSTNDSRPTSPMHVIRIDKSLATTDTPVGTFALEGRARWDRQLAVTKSGRVAVVWAVRRHDGVAILAAWRTERGTFGTPAEIDHVELERDAIELTLRTGVELRATAEGANAIAVAWRPLHRKPHERIDLGTEARPPTTGVTAEVRIVTVEGAPVLRASYPAFAHPLMFTSGVGPWPLMGSGIVATTIADRAVFFWIDGTEQPHDAVYATPYAPPRAIAEGSFRIVPRSARGSAPLDEILLLRSSGDQQVAPIECKPTRTARR